MTVAKLLVVGILLTLCSAASIAHLDAQTSPAPTRSAVPMPMHSGMSPAQMQMAKSPADSAMMAAMMQMHHSMMSVTLTGDADHDFMTMMIPHHQAAIDMARAELRYGKSPKVRELAQNIIKAQQAEIEAMQSMLHAKP
ncbi:MAG: CopM family metallochaperone [Vulcanimicrobiaceae bacterium]